MTSRGDGGGARGERRQVLIGSPDLHTEPPCSARAFSVVRSSEVGGANEVPRCWQLSARQRQLNNNRQKKKKKVCIGKKTAQTRGREILSQLLVWSVSLGEFRDPRFLCPSSLISLLSLSLLYERR
ncbi:hypothetical protein C0Q70_21049 [Pomacea canaliculata]|uniref:Uncharacterized protein n=1 Tax=Pomacea canaliculata TaxID=400727 RepID=A0A2T7NBE9_POMCA|nr:hypothetical protein C0Q70_21049 [Pomacea canaliculata]